MTKSTEVKRPSMLGHPKYRAREERRRLLKLCQRKLRSIEDPEQILRRAVLINNTMKQLQARDVCPGEEREGWGRQCEERTVELKTVETKGELKEVKATKEGRQPESRIPELPSTTLSTSTTNHSPTSSCYNIEDILSEIVLPPPLSPQLEDLTNFREEERRSHLACRERLAAPSTMATTLESSCPGSQCQPSSQPHLLSSPALQNSYDAVVPSTTSSSSSCNSFPPFDDPGAQEGFGELYHHHHHHHHHHQHHHHYQAESESGRMNLQCGAEDSMLQQDLYSPPLSSLLCKM